MCKIWMTIYLFFYSTTNLMNLYVYMSIVCTILIQRKYISYFISVFKYVSWGWTFTEDICCQMFSVWNIQKKKIVISKPLLILYHMWILMQMCWTSFFIRFRRIYYIHITLIYIQRLLKVKARGLSGNEALFCTKMVQFS